MQITGPRLMLVDDDSAVLETLSRLLAHFGFSVVPQNDSLQALTLLQVRQDIAGLVCDFEMPGIDGEQLARAAKAARPTMPVFICSGQHPPATEAPPWDGWFLKGGHILDLIRQLQAVTPSLCGDEGREPRPSHAYPLARSS